MKKIFLALLTVTALASCNNSGQYVKSEGSKFGLIQKVSAKNDLMCHYYVAEVAYEAGRSTAVTDEKGRTVGSRFSNSQEFQIDSVAFDTLQQYIGDRVVVSYKDVPKWQCGPDKIITSVRLKHSW